MVKVPNKFSHLEINKELQYALDAIVERKENVILIGRAGSGKSELINILKDVMSSSTVLLAPTGIAAVNIGGATIHSFFKFPPALLDVSKYYRRENVPEEVLQKLSIVKTIIIDEITMVRSDMMNAIDQCLRWAKVQKGRSKSLLPFGGVQMVLVGDTYQLPPVVKSIQQNARTTYGYASEEQDERSYLENMFGGVQFFKNNNFSDGSVCKWTKIKLSKVYRQPDKEFSDILNRIREGIHTIEDLEIINSRVMSINDFQSEISEKLNIFDVGVYLSPFNKVVDTYNSSELSKLPGRYLTYDAKKSHSDLSMKNFLVPEKLILKPFAKVMFLRNTESFCNGDIGIFKEETRDGHLVCEIEEKGEIIVPKFKFEEFEYKIKNNVLEKVSKSFVEQYPLKLAYAFTIHKSQGKTFETGYCDIGGSFGYHMVYVALSRFRHLHKLALKKPIKEKDIMICNEVKKFMETFDSSID